MRARWRKFPDEKPIRFGEYLVRGIGGLNNKLHHWVCLWIDDPAIPSNFYFNGNEFNQVPGGCYEWVDVNEL